MTNEQLLEDLKQYINARSSGLEKELKQYIKAEITGLESTMNERFDEVMNSEVIKDHERRITRLEHKLA